MGNITIVTVEQERERNPMDLVKSKRIQVEKRALNLSMYGGITFVIVEFIMSLVTNSQAILMDSAYDAAELVMIIASIRIIPLLYRPMTEKHPFGYSQVESIFITIKGSMLTAVTVGLVLNNIQIIMAGGRHVAFATIAYFELFATLLSALVILGLRRINKKLESPMVNMEINGWIIDTIASFGMAVAFILPSIIDPPWMQSFAPYLDQVMAITLSIFILPIPIKTVLAGLRDIFLLAPDEDTMSYIKETCQEILKEYDFENATYDVIKTGRKLWVSIYIKPKSDSILISKFAEVQKKIHLSLLAEFHDLYIELVPEIEF